MTGGAALAGFYTRHRETRGLDLFWHGLNEVAPVAAEVEARLRRAALEHHREHSTTCFCRLSAEAAGERVVLDLVADPTPTIEAPVEVNGLLIDTPYEILVNKLTALLSRSELRDLEDLRVLLESGHSLRMALEDAPQKDAGFSPLVLAWTLKSLPLNLANQLGFDQGTLERFREWLLGELTATAPERLAWQDRKALEDSRASR